MSNVKRGVQNIDGNRIHCSAWSRIVEP